METYVSRKETGEIDVKRFYIDAIIELKCPHCGAVCNDNLNNDYLSYPQIGIPEEKYLYCETCDMESEYKLKIKAIETVLEYSQPTKEIECD